MEEKRLFIIDLMPILYRGYFVFLRNPRKTASGINTSSLGLVASTIVQILQEYKPTHIAFATESDSPTFRHTLYPEYKAHRDKAPEDIVDSIPMAIELAEAMGISIIKVEGFEADDVLGTLADRGAKDGFDVCIASPDKDLGQLAGEHVRIFKDGKVYTAQEICEQWGLARPEQMLDYLALAGDTSDNIPGVPGVGPKTAVKLLSEWGSFDEVMAHASEIKGKLGQKILENEAIARMSQQLVTICRDVPMTLQWEDLQVKPLNAERLAPVLCKYELTAIARKLNIPLEQNYDDCPLFAHLEKPAPPAPSAPVPKALDDEDNCPLFATLMEEDSGLNKDLQAPVDKPLSDGTPVTSAEAPPAQNEEPVAHVHYRTLAEVPHTYTCVLTKEGVDEMVVELMQAPRIAFDTETTGLNPRVDRAVGCSFASAPGRAWYVGFPEDDDAVKAMLARMRPLFDDPDKIIVGHNLKFDRAVLQHYGFDFVGKTRDTILAHYLLDATDRHNMDHLARIYLHYTPIPIEMLIGANKKGSMGDHTPEEICDYAAEDADVTFRLDDVLRPLVAEAGMIELLEACEEPLQNVLLKMENTGVTIDRQALRTFSLELDREIYKIDAAIRAYTGGGVNIASPKQIGEILFGELKLDPAAKRSPRGQYTTNEETLLKIRERHPIVDLILDYRACMKLKNTYVDKLPTHINADTGRIHTTFNQAFTETGRLSSSNPNLQNIPIRSDRGQRIRAAFVPSDSDHVLIAADYSQVELRIMAAMSGDESMVQAFLDHADIHTQTAAGVYHIAPEAVTPQQRSYCKMVNFGIIYGISAFGLSQRLRIPRKEAAELIEAYFTRYPKVKTFMEQVIEKARGKGYAETLLGRRRNLPDLTSRNGATRQSAERIAVNMPVQGTAADIIKRAMIEMDQALTQQKLKSKIILQIHDELLFDVPRDEIEQMKVLIGDIFTRSWPLDVPVDFSIGVGESWLEAH